MSEEKPLTHVQSVATTRDAYELIREFVELLVPPSPERELARVRLSESLHWASVAIIKRIQETGDLDALEKEATDAIDDLRRRIETLIKTGKDDVKEPLTESSS